MSYEIGKDIKELQQAVNILEQRILRIESILEDNETKGEADR